MNFEQMCGLGIIIIAVVYLYLRKRSINEEKKRIKSEITLQYEILSVEICSQEIKELSFDQKQKERDTDGEKGEWYKTGLNDFRKKDIEDNRTDKKALRKKAMVLQNLIDCCEIGHVNVGEYASVNAVPFAIIAALFTILAVLIAIITEVQGVGEKELKELSGSLRIVILFFMPAVVILYADLLLYGPAVDEQGAINRVLRRKKILLMGARHEVEVSLLELEEENKLEEQRKQSGQKIGEDKVSKCSTAIEIFEMEFFRMKSEKEFKKI